MAKLEAMQAANEGRRANIVTHSMGGLVVQSFLAARPQDFERLVRPAFAAFWCCTAAALGLHVPV